MVVISQAKLPADEHHWTLVIISQHWFRWWLGAIRQQAIAWTNVDLDPCHHIASLGQNELIYSGMMTAYIILLVAILFPDSPGSLSWIILSWFQPLPHWWNHMDQWTCRQGIVHWEWRTFSYPSVMLLFIWFIQFQMCSQMTITYFHKNEILVFWLKLTFIFNDAMILCHHCFR